MPAPTAATGSNGSVLIVDINSLICWSDKPETDYRNRRHPQFQLAPQFTSPTSPVSEFYTQVYRPALNVIFRSPVTALFYAIPSPHVTSIVDNPEISMYYGVPFTLIQ